MPPSFLNISPEAKQKLIQMNKDRKQWTKRINDVNSTYNRNYYLNKYSPDGFIGSTGNVNTNTHAPLNRTRWHDSIHMLPAWTTPNSKGIGVSKRNEGLVSTIQGAVENSIGKKGELLPDVGGTVYSYPKMDSSFLLKNSKGKLRPINAVKAQQQYLTSSINNLNTDPILNEAFTGMNKAARKGMERQIAKGDKRVTDLNSMNFKAYSYMDSAEFGYKATIKSINPEQFIKSTKTYYQYILN